MAWAVTAAIDMGPTFGKDYAGQDYNVTSWHSSTDKAANHYEARIVNPDPEPKANPNHEASAKECEAYCLNDPKCCSWTYCPPGSGSGSSGPFRAEELGERCCLKNGVPAEVGGTTHWTGVAPRAVNNGGISKLCKAPPPPPPENCKTWDGKCVMPYPGDSWTHPKIHQSPDCLHLGGWHDVAGALSYKGDHHVMSSGSKSDPNSNSDCNSNPNCR